MVQQTFWLFFFYNWHRSGPIWCKNGSLLNWSYRNFVAWSRKWGASRKFASSSQSIWLWNYVILTIIWVLKLIDNVDTFLSIYNTVDQLIYVGSYIYVVRTMESDKTPIVETIDNLRIRHYIPIWMAHCIQCSIVVIRLFIWNFLHVFIMAISVGLSTHFKLINDRIERTILFGDSILYPRRVGVNSVLEVNFWLVLMCDMFILKFTFHSTFRDIITNSGLACVEIIWGCAV